MVRTQASQLPDAALAARLRASAEKARREAYADLGIEDPEKFKADREAEKKKLEAFEKSAEEARKASMSEVDRLKSELAERDATIVDLRNQLATREGDVQAAKADLIVRETIADHIDPSMFEDAQRALRDHVRKLPKEAQRRFGKEQAAEFFAKLAKEKVRYAKDAGTAPPPAAKPPPAKRPLGNGASPAKAAPGGPARPLGAPPNGAAKKTKAEIAEAWKRRGVHGTPYG